MSYYISKLILKIIGWKITGFDISKISKCVCAVVPHTSFWDFPIGLLARGFLRTNIMYVGKQELFKGIVGWFLRITGGIPVKRGVKTSFVEDVAALFEERDELRIALAIEGTRKQVTFFKSGFYRIATLAKVPVVLVKFDYANKEVHFGEPYLASDDKKAEMEKVESYFKGVMGKHPDRSFN